MTNTQRRFVSLTVRLTLLVTVVIAFILFIAPTHDTGTNTGTTQPALERIEEDQPGWDCHTMGNRVCG